MEQAVEAYAVGVSSNLERRNAEMMRRDLANYLRAWLEGTLTLEKPEVRTGAKGGARRDYGRGPRSHGAIWRHDLIESGGGEARAEEGNARDVARRIATGDDCGANYERKPEPGAGGDPTGGIVERCFGDDEPDCSNNAEKRERSIGGDRDDGRDAGARRPVGRRFGGVGLVHEGRGLIEQKGGDNQQDD